MSCTVSLLLHVSVRRGDLPMESRGMEHSSLHSGWHSLHGASAWKHQGCTALLTNGEVWPEDCKTCYFCNFHPCNYTEYNREDYLDSSLTLFSHYSSSSKDGGGSEAILGGCAFFMVMSYDVLICQIKYMSQHFHLYLLHACKINSHINHPLPFSLEIRKQFAKMG